MEVNVEVETGVEIGGGVAEPGVGVGTSGPRRRYLAARAKAARIRHRALFIGMSR